MIKLRIIIASLLSVAVLTVEGQAQPYQNGKPRRNSDASVIQVDLAKKTLERLKPIWSWFGYYEANYTYMKEGSWEYRGIIEGNVPNSFTTHPGIIDYKGKSYFFYHNGSLPTGGSYRRSICVDYMYYNPDGTIQKIIQTAEGAKPAK
jgi:hypothetical protein